MHLEGKERKEKIRLGESVKVRVLDCQILLRGQGKLRVANMTNENGN